MTHIDKYDLYKTRLLVFLEEDPQSNKYRQIILTAEQFKNMSDAVCTVESRIGDDEEVTMRLSDEIYTLPDLPETEDDMVK